METGTQVPDVKLPDQDGNEVSLKDFKGKWTVLYFYPKDDTPGCTTEACDFTEQRPQFESLDVNVVGCSPDSPESHRKFIEKHKLNLRLLSDPQKKLMEPFGAWGKKVMYGKESIGVKRSTFIIDPEGKVAHGWKSVQVKGHVDKVREKLAELKG
jgi:peroxiredoxin Q/BCP